MPAQLSHFFTILPVKCLKWSIEQSRRNVQQCCVVKSRQSAGRANCKIQDDIGEVKKWAEFL
jgi:hypothetical protein